MLDLALPSIHGSIPSLGHPGSPVGPVGRVAQLVNDARAGDSTAFAQLYAEHVTSVRRYARRLADHEQKAEDLVAEAFARTWAQVAAGGGPRVAFGAYVRAAVLNLHLSALKRDGAMQWVSDVEDAALANPVLAARIAEVSPEEIALERLFNARLKEAMASLPDRWQVVLVKVYVENQPYLAVATDMGLSVEATRQLARRARDGMRRALAERAARDPLT